MHIVVLNEHEVPLEIAVLAQVNDVLDIPLAIIVARMRFAGEHKL